MGCSWRFTNVVPGRYQVALRSTLAGWRMASAVFGGRDALDFMLDVKPGDALTGVVTLTKRETAVSGEGRRARSPRE